ncbi:MAG: alanine racemase [Firmicutes bacterium]|nr:alanine racemase [Bacillota bacterium]
MTLASSALRQANPASRPWEALGPAWVEVDLDVLATNLVEIVRFVRRPPDAAVLRRLELLGLRPPDGPPRVLVVVKADGYGHGAVQVARTAAAGGADMLGVSTLLEAVELRRAGLDLPILMFNPLTPAEAPAAVEHGLTVTVTGLLAAEALSREADKSGRAPVPVHVCVDTGLARFGVHPDAAPALAAAVAALPGLELEGVYTHFSAGSGKGPAAVALMREQFGRFARVLAAVEARGLRVPLRHASASAAVLRVPESYLDLVRVGNLLYGFGADGDPGTPRVREAWAMYARVIEAREVPAGTGVGYGPDVVVRRPTRLVTVPLGYADGVGAEVRQAAFRPRTYLNLLARNLIVRLARRGLLRGPLARFAHRRGQSAIFSHDGHPLDILGRIAMHDTILDATGWPEVGTGSLVRVNVRRVLANPRLPRVYRRRGRVVLACPALPEGEAALLPAAAPVAERAVPDAEPAVPPAVAGG